MLESLLDAIRKNAGEPFELNLEVTPDKITVTLLHPGTEETGFGVVLDKKRTSRKSISRDVYDVLNEVLKQI